MCVLKSSRGLAKEAIQSHLRGSFGRELEVYDLVDSTNNAAKLLAKNGAPSGSAVLAHQQSAGKGRLGRGFFSPPEAGVYLSIILRPRLAVEQTMLLTCGAAVATAQAVAAVCGVEPRIKWVNDLYAEGKKLCGILAESALGSDGLPLYVVMGIGVNVSVESFPPELSEKATSLAHVGAGEVDKNRLAAEILNGMEDVFNDLESKRFLETYRKRSCVLGKQIEVLGAGEPYLATATEIDENGWLHVRDGQGTVHILNSGEISLKGAFL